MDMNIYNLKAVKSELNKYIIINNLFESNNYIFFRFTINEKGYSGIFNKSTKKTTICKLDKANESAFIDDINNFIPLIPLSITQNNEMICTLDPENILKWINKYPDKVKTLPENMDWVKSISLTSNPVILIARLKD